MKPTVINNSNSENDNPNSQHNNIASDTNNNNGRNIDPRGFSQQHPQQQQYQPHSPSSQSVRMKSLPLSIVYKNTM